MNSLEMRRTFGPSLLCEGCGRDLVSLVKRRTTLTRIEEISFVGFLGGDPLNDFAFKDEREEQFVCWSCDHPVTWRQNALISRIYAAARQEFYDDYEVIAR